MLFAESFLSSRTLNPLPKIAIIDSQKNILHSAYSFHKGQIIENLQRLLHEVDLSELTPGIYIVRMMMGDEVETRKLVVY